MGKDGVHPGTAYTLITPKQASFAGDLAYHLEVSFAAFRQMLICNVSPSLLPFGYRVVDSHQ